MEKQPKIITTGRDQVKRMQQIFFGITGISGFTTGINQKGNTVSKNHIKIYIKKNILFES